jgi:hypothetical protein
MPHAEEQADGAAPGIGPDETCQRPDARPGPDENEGAVAAGMEAGVLPQEGVDRIARLQLEELAGAQAGGCFLTTISDETVATRMPASRTGERQSFRQDPRRSPATKRPKPRPVSRTRMAASAAQSAGWRSAPAPRRHNRGANQRQREGCRLDRLVDEFQLQPHRRPQRLAPAGEILGDWRFTVMNGTSMRQPPPPPHRRRPAQKRNIRKAAIAEAENRQRPKGPQAGDFSRSRNPRAEAGAAP